MFQRLDVVSRKPADLAYGPRDITRAYQASWYVACFKKVEGVPAGRTEPN